MFSFYLIMAIGISLGFLFAILLFSLLTMAQKGEDELERFSLHKDQTKVEGHEHFLKEWVYRFNENIR